VARLGKDRWLDEALVVLARDGAEAVTPEILAARLGQQPGLFTFHFGDRAAFWRALVERWRDAATADPDAALHVRDPAIELGLRAAAGRDPTLRAVVAEVDAARLAALERAIAAEHPTLDAGARAALARLELAAYVGAALVFADDRGGVEGVGRTLAALLARAHPRDAGAGGEGSPR
jgi:AcrR family transcriptional regulator